MLNRFPVGAKVLIAPAMIIVLMVGVIATALFALHQQQSAFFRVIGGSFKTSTMTTRLLLSVAEVQSDVLRYTQLEQRLPPGDQLLTELRRSIKSRYGAIDALFNELKTTTSGSGEADAVVNIADFLTIHRAVVLRIVDGQSAGTTMVSTLMAHYQQLQSYIVELGSRTAESARMAEQEAALYVTRTSQYILFGALAVVIGSAFIAYYVGRAISQPITQMISTLTAIAHGNFNVPVIGLDRRDELGAMARSVDVFASVSRELREREQSLQEALRRLEDELDAARALQLGMLPSEAPECTPSRPMQIFASMEPAREVGGDLYDFFYEADSLFCFLVGDVSGKGASAAMFMARTRSLVRMAVRMWAQLGATKPFPSQILETVNRELCENNAERMFVTVFMAFFDPGTGVLRYVNAGHPTPYLLRSSGVSRIHKRPEPPLGVHPGARYTDFEVALAPGECLFACTDGVAEAMNTERAFYTEQRLHEFLTRNKALAPHALTRKVRDELHAFAGDAPQADDITMLAVRWQPLASDVTLRETTNVIVRNDFAELPLLRDAVDRLARRHAIPGRAVMQLQVALDEIVSNAIKYAWPEGGQHQIHVRISVFSDRVELEVMDDGLSFDLRQTPELYPAAPGTRRRPGGVGVHLVRQLMDTIEYRRSGGCNHVLLTKRCALGVYASEQ